MSVQSIILRTVAVLILGGFITLGISDIVKTSDKIEFQKVELKSKSFEVQRLNGKYDKLNTELEKAKEDKSTSQEELDKLRKQQEELEKQKQNLEQQLQAKLEQKNRLASASTTVGNAITGTSVASANTGDLKTIITQAAIKNGLDPNWFWNLAGCESTWNPGAVNYSYNENGHPSGLYQHISGYWPGRAAQHGYPGASVFDPVANANVTAAMWASGSHLWDCQ